VNDGDNMDKGAGNVRYCHPRGKSKWKFRAIRDQQKTHWWL